MLPQMDLEMILLLANAVSSFDNFILTYFS